MVLFFLFLQFNSYIFALEFLGIKAITTSMKVNFKKNLNNIKIFFLAFFAFLAANYLYNNIITKSTANNIKFLEVEVEMKGNVDFNLKCEGANNPNPSSINRGLGEQTESNCTGTGTFSAIIPQQRFTESSK